MKFEIANEVRGYFIIKEDLMNYSSLNLKRQNRNFWFKMMGYSLCDNRHRYKVICPNIRKILPLNQFLVPVKGFSPEVER